MHTKYNHLKIKCASNRTLLHAEIINRQTTNGTKNV